MWNIWKKKQTKKQALKKTRLEGKNNFGNYFFQIGNHRISDCKWYAQFTPGFDHDYVNHIVAISDFVS